MKKLTLERFLELSLNHHGDYYDYIKVDLQNRIKSKVIIICPIHGEFLQNPHEHKDGHGCYDCGILKIKKHHSKILIKDRDDFIKQCKEQFGNNFDYSNVNYINTGIPVEIKCMKHNQIFYPTPHHHIRGHGCDICRREKIGDKSRMDFEEFITRSNLIHKNKYDYSKIEYNTQLDNITIICPIHDDFLQKPRDHLNGNGCQRCGFGSISEISQQWLDECNILSKYREYPLELNGNKIKVDGYNPSTNTIYEFWGDFWHGNLDIFEPDKIHPILKKTYLDLNIQTLERKQLLESFGYNIIDIWEKEYHDKLRIRSNS